MPAICDKLRLMARFITRPSHLIRGLLFAGGCTLVAVQSGCRMCHDIGCAGGFEWNARAVDSSPLAPGDYQLEALLDGAVFKVKCTVVPPSEGQSTCAEPSIPEGAEYELVMGLQQVLDGEDWLPAQGFTLVAINNSADGGRSVEGPRTVQITVMRDDAPFLNVDYDVEYERVEDYYGDPSCGYCELEQSRIYEWE